MAATMATVEANLLPNTQPNPKHQQFEQYYTYSNWSNNTRRNNRDMGNNKSKSHAINAMDL